MRDGLRIGNETIRYGKRLKEATCSTHMYKEGDFDGLRQRLNQDGYLWIQGVINRTTVLEGRRKMIETLSLKGAIKPTPDLNISEKNNFNENRAYISDCKLEGWCVDAESGGTVGDRDDDVKLWHAVGNSEALTNVYNGKDLKKFCTDLFGNKSRLLPGCTWLRAKGKGEITAEHVDYFYFYKNTGIMGDSSALHPKQVKGQSTQKAEEVAERRLCPIYHTLDSGPEGLECSHCGKHQPCEVCGKASNPQSLLICDICCGAFHTSCCSPALKEIPDTEEWHCHTCANEPFPVYTCWVPLGSVTPSNGILAIQPGTHVLSGYKRPINGLLPAEYASYRTRKRRRAQDESKGRKEMPPWVVPPKVEAGDLIVFNIKTVHAASRNKSKEFRLSLDTRLVAKDIVSSRVRRVLQNGLRPPPATSR
ncbi:hypothetical protein AAMO2058_001471400 [Amorphochlora amoebiformis]